METKIVNNYLLRTDALGRKRLNLQGKVYNPGSQQFLIKQGIKKGQSILEVGCGSGSMTPWLAEQVGKSGRVLAIDNNPSQILAMQRLVKKLDLKQVECKELSVFDLDELKEKFDIIYLRCVLVHLTDPDAALIKISQRLKKKGKIVVNDMLNSCNFCYPKHPSFDKRRSVLEQFFIENGLNPNFCLTLKARLKKLGFKNIQENLFQPILMNKDERKLLTFVLYEVKDQLISLGILTISEWEKFISDLEQIQKDKNYFIALTSLHQMSAEK